ncbi:MAG TPA: hypothetical protein VKC57_05465 [Ktedonobacterales bacterium]|nr:hypothetical protein [Ktedonobacterales bacterium]
MIEPRELGEEGVAYIRERLRSGETLSSQLLGLDLERGTAWAYLPTALSDEQAHTFREGYNLALRMQTGHSERS